MNQLDNLKVGMHVVVNPEHDYSFSLILTEVNVAKREVTDSIIESDINDKKRKLHDAQTVPYHDISQMGEPDNMRYVMSQLRHWSGWHPDVDLLCEVMANHPEKEERTMLWSSLEWMARKAHTERQSVLRAYAAPVWVMADEFSHMGEHNGIFNIAEELMKKATDTKLDDMRLSEHETFMLKHNRLRLKLAKMGLDQLRKILTPEAQAELLKDFDSKGE